MKNELIGCCGIDCDNCDARIATINNDNALREQTASLWSKLNGATITADMIHCTGCRLDGAKPFFAMRFVQCVIALNRRVFAHAPIARRWMDVTLYDALPSITHRLSKGSKSCVGCSEEEENCSPNRFFLERNRFYRFAFGANNNERCFDLHTRKRRFGGGSRTL